MKTTVLEVVVIRVRYVSVVLMCVLDSLYVCMYSLLVMRLIGCTDRHGSLSDCTRSPAIPHTVTMYRPNRAEIFELVKRFTCSSRLNLKRKNKMNKSDFYSFFRSP